MQGSAANETQIRMPARGKGLSTKKSPALEVARGSFEEVIQ
jgi:hypothetical protein